MSCLFIGKLIGTPFRDGHDVVDNVCGGVEVVGDVVVDGLVADAAGWFTSGDDLAMPIADGRTAAGAHSSTSM